MPSAQLVVTGDTIPIEPNTLVGHGVALPQQHININNNQNGNDSKTAVESDTVIATLSGTITRVNKLITIHPLTGRYTPDVGDVVVGRVVAITDNKWKVDVGAQHYAHLSLSAVYLPDGVQRRKTADDELYMTQLYSVGDIISAEVQKVQQGSGIPVLHTRNIKYGKLLNGQLVQVNSHLIKRCKQHFQSLDGVGVHIILGANGSIWVYDQTAQPVKMEDNDVMASGTDAGNKADLSDQYTVYTAELIKSLTTSARSREAIARVRNCVLALAQNNKLIWNSSIVQIYTLSIQHKLTARQLCDPASVAKLLELSMDKSAHAKRQKVM